MTDQLNLEQAAERLSQSRAFVERMIAKDRLHPDAQRQLSVQEVEQLAQLLDRLRQSGVATLFDAMEEEL